MNLYIQIASLRRCFVCRLADSAGHGASEGEREKEEENMRQQRQEVTLCGCFSSCRSSAARLITASSLGDSLNVTLDMK